MFYQRLRELLDGRGLSDKEFLSDIGMSKNQMTNWKNGKIPNKSTLLLIANYFGVTMDYLLGREGKMAVLEQKALDILDGNVVFNEQEKELLEAFRSTTEKGRFKIIQAVMNICDEIEKKSASSDTSVTDQ